MPDIGDGKQQDRGVANALTAFTARDDRRGHPWAALLIVLLTLVVAAGLFVGASLSAFSDALGSDSGFTLPLLVLDGAVLVSGFWWAWRVGSGHGEGRPQPVPPPPPPSDEPSVVWAPTHQVPAGGMRVWKRPTLEGEATTALSAGTPVRASTTSGDSTRVAESSGQTGWVDGRLLVPLATDKPPPPPA
jgi:hypothetical protein